MAELLFDLDYVKAEYARECEVCPSAGDLFRATLRVSDIDLRSFEIILAENPQLAAELDVLTSLMRARRMKALFDRDVVRRRQALSHVS